MRYAKIVRHEERQYLDCWCDETERNQDVEALSHNWSLRLDRIPEEAVISLVKGHWQPELDLENSHSLAEPSLSLLKDRSRFNKDALHVSMTLSNRFFNSSYRRLNFVCR